MTRRRKPWHAPGNTKPCWVVKGDAEGDRIAVRVSRSRLEIYAWADGRVLDPLVITERIPEVLEALGGHKG